MLRIGVELAPPAPQPASASPATSPTMSARESLAIVEPQLNVARLETCGRFGSAVIAPPSRHYHYMRVVVSGAADRGNDSGSAHAV